MIAASHPSHCAACHGSGLMAGPLITERAAGTVVRYSTVTTCTHEHWNDDPGGGYVLPPRTVIEQARAQGRAELHTISGGQSGQPLPPPEPTQTRLELNP